MTPEFLGLEGRRIDFWDLSWLDVKLPPQVQADHLKEDLAQVVLSSSVILDIGWYPCFDPEGEFMVLVVRDYDWQVPLYTGRSSSWEGLRGHVEAGLGAAGTGRRTEVS